MSFEILENMGGTTYAPLNTTIDADRDYYNLTGLDACACGGGSARTRAQMGTGPHPAAGSQPNAGMSGYYAGGIHPEGMLQAVEAPNKLLWLLGGVAAMWAIWAWNTPHAELEEW